MSNKISNFYKPESSCFMNWLYAPMIAVNAMRETPHETCDVFTFGMRLAELSCGYITSKFDWDGVVIAGQLVHAMTGVNFASSEKILQLYVYGQRETITATMARLLEWLNRAGNMVLVAQTQAAITIIDPHDRITIQITATPFTSAQQIAEMFDMTHNQIAFNGREIITSSAYTASIRTNITHVASAVIDAWHLAAAHYAGFAIAKPTRDCAIRNCFDATVYCAGAAKYDAPTMIFGELYDWDTLQENIASLMQDPVVIRYFADIVYGESAIIWNAREIDVALDDWQSDILHAL